jgi:hypothetical protein
MGTTQYFKDGTTGSFAVQADLTTRYYSVGVNAAGTVLMLQGPVVGATPPAIGAFDGANGKLPDTPLGCALLGYMKIVTNGGTFTMGTTDLSGTGVTATFEEWGLEPDDADVA